MLSRELRIPRKLFYLLKKARIFRNSLFLAKILYQPQIPSRFSFSVSKKVAKLAVDRNKLRRQGYQALKEHLLDLKPNFLIQFSFLEVPTDKKVVVQKLEAILKEANLLK